MMKSWWNERVMRFIFEWNVRYYFQFALIVILLHTAKNYNRIISVEDQSLWRERIPSPKKNKNLNMPSKEKGQPSNHVTVNLGDE